MAQGNLKLDQIDALVRHDGGHAVADKLQSPADRNADDRPRTLSRLSDAGHEQLFDDDCPGPLVQIDETVTEILDYAPAHFRVIRHVRPSMACRHCERIHQVPAGDLPLPKVMATCALHAHLLVSRFVDHQP